MNGFGHDWCERYEHYQLDDGRHKALKKRVEEMEERLQTLADLHNESELEVRDEYLSHLDELDEKGEFERFSNIGELRRRIENAEI